MSYGVHKVTPGGTMVQCATKLVSFCDLACKKVKVKTTGSCTQISSSQLTVETMIEGQSQNGSMRYGVHKKSVSIPVRSLNWRTMVDKKPHYFVTSQKSPRKKVQVKTKCLLHNYILLANC